ncbi:Protein of unknown function (DUF726) domain containing protein [Naviculisporaceae sp. PSN 640]
MPERDNTGPGSGSAAPAAASPESSEEGGTATAAKTTTRADDTSRCRDTSSGVSKGDRIKSQQPQSDGSSSVTTGNDPPAAPAQPAEDKSTTGAQVNPTTNTTTSATATTTKTTMTSSEPPELDDFGLPIRKYVAPPPAADDDYSTGTSTPVEKAKDSQITEASASVNIEKPHATKETAPADKGSNSDSEQEFKDARSGNDSGDDTRSREVQTGNNAKEPESGTGTGAPEQKEEKNETPTEAKGLVTGGVQEDQAIAVTKEQDAKPAHVHGHARGASTASATAAGGADATNQPAVPSEFSHQQLTTHKTEKADDSDGEWQEMPAYAPYDIYDDDNKLIAREHNDEEDEKYGYAGLGGAGKGYTKVLLDDDAESATSMDENTNYLFKEKASTALIGEDDDQRDAVGQLQATKELLTEGQRIAYVGLTRLELSAMLSEVEAAVQTSKKSTKKELNVAAESLKMWSQKMMIRLYSHMDISPAEQIMIEQLSAHGVMPKDLTPVLMANARVKNPMAEEDAKDKEGSTSPGAKSPRKSSSSTTPDTEEVAEPPPPYEANDDSELSAPVRTPSQMPTTQKIDIDLRWTVLCDLFLVLIADSIYDARSRVLLERVAKDLEIPWLDICRFEKKVTDALEMQQNAEKENWNEEDHMEMRRKQDLTRRYVLMGLATVGGGLVIGLSAGLLAPMIGAGLAAGFATIGVGGTSGFLAGAGGAAIITSSAAASGSIIGVRAANRRTGSVKTFEYRPLHNNKRVNLIVTVSGWMTGKVDDVRLPFSTVDPVMGDIYSVLWEPEMLTSMGDTINILATEALTQGLQQILGSTILIGLMSALQLPVVLTKLSYLIDNPWTVSLDRATMAGKILADSLIDRNLGTRPVTLVGYSLGSRVIFSCLLELAKKGAYGLVQNVYLFGSPIVVKQDEYLRARSVVAGRFLSGYNRNDWILGYLFRLTNGGIRRVAGLAAIEGIPGIENMDVSEFVVGHMDYRNAMPRLLRECGWNVESDEFTEIEDPDPDQHQERQRELINEIEEARKEFEKESKGKSGRFSFFRKKKAQKQEWEIYEDPSKSAASGTSGSGSGKTEDAEGNNHGVLFDVDAIRAELAKEQAKAKANGGQTIEEELLQVREIKSTLPPMKLDLSPGLPPAVRSTSRDGRENRSVSLSAVPSRSAALAQDPWSSHARQPSYSHNSSQRTSSERTQTYPMDRAEERTSSPYQGYGQPGAGYGGGGGGGGGFGGHDDDEIQMTFDTSYNTSPKASAYSGAAANGGYTSSSSISRGRQPSIVVKPAEPEKLTSSTTTRPALTTSQTAPPPPPPASNPWANLSDDDDEDFGKEKEISMTFA